MQDSSDSLDNGVSRWTSRRNTRFMESSRRLSGDLGDWDRELLYSLKEDIQSFSPPPSSHVEQARILMLGPVGAGKSSFYNTIAAIFNGHISIYAPSGSAEQSLTSKYRMYQLRCPESGIPMKFRLCDTRGLEEHNGIDSEDIRPLLDGQVPNNYLFQDSPHRNKVRTLWKTWRVLRFVVLWIWFLLLWIVFVLDWISYKFNVTQLQILTRPACPRFSQQVPLKDKIHCVCMLIDGSTAGVLPEKLLEKIKNIQILIRDVDIPFLIIMTKLDKLCEEVDEDISKAFNSKAIQDQVNRISQIFGVPRNHVLLVKNYEKEYTLNVNVSILALRALRNILGATRDYMNGVLQE